MKLLIRKIDGEWWLNARQLGEIITAFHGMSALGLLEAIRDAMRRGFMERVG